MERVAHASQGTGRYPVATNLFMERRRTLLPFLATLLLAPSSWGLSNTADFDQGRLPVVEFPAFRPPLPPVKPAPRLPTVHRIGDSTVAVLVGGLEFEKASLAAIEGASESLELEMFQFANETLIEALAARARNGVRVRVLLSPIPGRFQILALRRLRRAGVEVSFYPARSLSGAVYRIDHVKLLIADQRRAVFGGSNWKPNVAQNHDFNLLLEGTIVGSLGRIFESSWRLAVGLPGPPSPPPAPGETRILLTGPGQREVIEETLSQINAARRSILSEQLQLSEPRVIDALAAAAGRGVEIRLLLDGRGYFVGGFNENAAKRLKNSGAQVRLFKGDTPELHRLHAKLAIFDGETIMLGSANWSRNSMRASHEAALLMRDSGLAQELASVFEADWDSRSRPPSDRRRLVISLLGWLLDRGAEEKE